MKRSKENDVILAPLEDGNQKYAIRSNADFVVFSGPVGSGKSFALYYAPIEYLSMNDNAKIVCFMRNISDFWGAGKVADTLKKMYPLIDRGVKRQPRDPIGEILRKNEDMGMRLYNGSELKFQQLDNENPIVLDRIAKGLQAKILIFDECNKFEWKTITTFMARLRSDSNGKAQIFLAQNPERLCALRKICGKGEHGGGWINDDGTVDKEMDGAVMYFYMHQGNLEEMYWGRSKVEVYEKAKDKIDALLEIDKDMSYEDFILSMVFFTFDMRDNKKMLAKNKSYRGMAANSATAASSYANNWNYSITDEDVATEDEMVNTLIKQNNVEMMFHSMEIPYDSVLQKRFITVDMATTGFDNFVMMYWELWSGYGFLCKDIKYSMKNTNKEAVYMINEFRTKHGWDAKLIIDVQGFGFLRDCYPDAIQFAGASQSTKRGKNLYKTLKDEASHLAVEMVCNGLVHFDHRLAEMRYMHQNMSRSGGTTIKRHMLFESVIFQFSKTPNGRLVMLEKEKQKKLLKGMSPDLFDNVIMLCGGSFYDCYRILATDAGMARKRMQSEEMFAMLDVGGTREVTQNRGQQKIRNSHRILNILSSI